MLPFCFKVPVVPLALFMSCKLDSTFFTGRPWLEQRPDPVAVRVTTALAPLAAAMPTISVTSPHANPASPSLLLLPFIYNHPSCLFLTPLPYLLILVSFGLFLTFMFFICFLWFRSSFFFPPLPFESFSVVFKFYLPVFIFPPSNSQLFLCL